MSARILSGKELRDSMLPDLISRFSGIDPVPVLAIIQVGDRVDSSAYIRAKTNFAKKVGVETKHIVLESEADIISSIEAFNADGTIKGIIVQLPLPEKLNREKIIDSIDPKKDVDGLTSNSSDLLYGNKPGAIVPATARGVKELIDHYGIDLKDKKVTVIGRSALVGKPIAQLMRNSGSIVSVAHSKTEDLVSMTKDADIIISAVGKIGLITKDHVRPGQVIIDVGINTLKGDKLEEEVGKRKLVGDVDFEPVKDAIGPNGSITPVPGGVGPMTVLALFENLADLC